MARKILVLGQVHGRLGGPARTIKGYVDGLAAEGHEVWIAGVGSINALEDNFGQCAASRLIAIPNGLFHGFSRLRKLSVDSPATYIVVGVWHSPFFIIGIMTLARRIRRITHRAQTVLIPTMSLTEYDWKKHRNIKRTLLPLVALILRSFNGVIFASTGELRMSRPKTWSRSCVILHPTIMRPLVNEPSSRPRDVLFVGRLDPQKDIPLLLDSLSLSHARHLDIAGDGNKDYVRQLKLHAQKSGLAKRVHWHGWVDQDVVRDYYRRSKLVVVTSLIENFCHVAAEAVANGCELVLVDRVLSAEDFAELADISIVNADAESISLAIDECLQNFDSRASARDSSSRAVVSTCSPQVAARKLAAFIAPSAPIS
jgi:glycosyltransferase involved in cell wall biosynthesis